MSALVSAANANRSFSRVLRQVRAGASVTVTSHGRPVARIVPIADGEAVRSRARTTLFGRLRGNRIRRAAAWKRDDLYDTSR
jgi:prevent-host-death family protein